MKLQYKLSILALGLVAFTSCDIHDPVDDVADPGQYVPTCYWEVGSTTCKAGDSFSFQGKYYTEAEFTPDHSEVWYSVLREENASAGMKLTSLMAYTKSYSKTDTVRSSQCYATFPHSLAEWDGYEYVIKGEVPTSSQLAPKVWNTPETWDQARFDGYFPANFEEEFCADVVNRLTRDSTYYSALRDVYMKYPFPNSQFAEVNSKYGVNLPTDIKYTEDEQEAVTDKANRWFATTEASEEAIIGYYYKTVDAYGNTVIHEVPKDYVNPEVNLYPVYNAAEWVFCRYDDDLGAIISTVRAKYMPAFKDLVQTVKFEEWVYDSSNRNYNIAFDRKYSLQSRFRVVDNKGNVGTAYDVRVISLN